MEITIEAHTGIGVASGMAVTLDQYRIRVDGLCAGFVPFADCAPIMMTRRFSPGDLKEIQAAVDALKGSGSVSITQPADIPQELLDQIKSTEEEGIDDNDIDS